MIGSFKSFLTEEESVAYFTFGRMNPPTSGHEKLLDSLSNAAGKNPYFVFLSQSQDKKKNPLKYGDKVKHVRKMFPRHARRILINKKVRTAFDSASYIFEQGYKNLVMVVGSDRVREFETLLSKYNGKKGNHGFYNFKSIKVISAGERDPDAEGVEGMSASKLRGYALDNNFTQFSQGLGSMSNKDAKKLFTDVRSGMGLKKESVFSRHIELEPVSEARERFVRGELFEVGDQVIVKESGEMGVVTHLGSNYVIVEFKGNVSVRKWLHSVERVEEAISVPSSAEFVPGPSGEKKSTTLNMGKEINTGLKKAIKLRNRRNNKSGE
jgi:hypothetical protein